MELKLIEAERRKAYMLFEKYLEKLKNEMVSLAAKF